MNLFGKRRKDKRDSLKLRSKRNRIIYYRKHELKYYSVRYAKWITVPKGYPSDGATGAIDIYSDAWWCHDKLTDTGLFDDGTKCNNWQASQILSDILKSEGRYIRAQYWFTFTYLLGGGAARRNGMG